MSDASGENTDGGLNFEPVMQKEKLIEGYQKILTTLYSPKNYYRRINTFLKSYTPTAKTHLTREDLLAFIRAAWRLGIVSKARFRYWKLLAKTFFVKRRALPIAWNSPFMVFISKKYWSRVCRPSNY